MFFLQGWLGLWLVKWQDTGYIVLLANDMPGERIVSIWKVDLFLATWRRCNGCGLYRLNRWPQWSILFPFLRR